MNLVNLDAVSKSYGPKRLLDAVSIGVAAGERIGVVGRNGGGKSALASIIAGRLSPDAGRVTHARDLRVGLLEQRSLDRRDEIDPALTVRGLVLGDTPEHAWAGDPRIRDVLAGLLGLGGRPSGAGLERRIELDAAVADLSGGERRRVALAGLLVAEHDLLVLDEPTNHLDIEAIDWLAGHLRDRSVALVNVTHDRWFLDATCEVTWEVGDGSVRRYDGGYAAYVLAKAERERQAALSEERRSNLVRKELAWLRRGPQARTSKPKFRVEVANALIAGEPPPRDHVQLTAFAAARLGKTVYDAEDVTLAPGGRTLLDHATWRLGPGDRIGLVGANGSGKSSLLRLLAGEARPASGDVRVGKTVRAAQSVPGASRARRCGPGVGVGRTGAAAHHGRRQRILGQPAARAPRLRRRRSVDPCRRPLRRRAAQAPDPAPVDERTERLATRRTDQRPGHRDAHRTRGHPRRLAGNPRRGQPRPVFPRTRLRHGDGTAWRRPSRASRWRRG